MYLNIVVLMQISINDYHELSLAHKNGGGRDSTQYNIYHLTVLLVTLSVYRVSIHLTRDALVKSLFMFSRLAGCRLLHPLFQRYLGSELQPDVSVRQRGSM